MVYTVNSASEINWNPSGKAERIISNIQNLLRIRKYDVPFLRTMGLSSEYIDSNIAQTSGQITGEIIKNIQRYEPRATINSVEITGVDTDGNLILTAEVII